MTPRHDIFGPTMVTLTAGIVWALLMLVHVMFWSSSFDWLQNISIGVLSLVVTGCVIGFVWVYWVFRRH